MGKHQTLGCSIFAVVFALVALIGCRQPSFSEVPTVTKVTVSRVDGIHHSNDIVDTVARGGTAYLEVVVEGTNNPPQSVNWYIADGGRRNGTRIGADGVLRVAADERLESLTIGARSTFDMRRFGHITLYLHGDIPESNGDLPQLDAPVIWLDYAMVRWLEVPGAGGYSLRIGGIEVDGGNLAHTETSFNLVGLGLPVGAHVVTLVALGVSGQSLDSPASSSITFYVIIATGVTVTVTLPDLRDMAGYINIEGPSFSMLDPEGPGQIVFDGQHYNVTDVEWFLGEDPVPTGTVSEDGNILTLDARIHGNRKGTHFVTLEVIMGGIRYSRVIAFTVGL